MITKETATTSTTQPAAETPPASTHVDDAKVMIQDIKGLGQRFPTFTFPTDANSNRKLSPTATVPMAALARITDLVQTNPLLTGNDIGPAELRDLVNIAVAYSSVPDEAEAFAGAARHTLTATLAKAGSAALTAYEVAKRQAKRPEGADLRPHVADIKRLLGTRFPGKKKKSAQAPQSTPQVPAPTAPSPSSSTSSAPAPTSSQPKVQSVASAASATDPVVTTPVTAPRSQ